MMTRSDMRKLTSLSEESRAAAIGVFDALTDWRDALSAVNERCLARVLDRVTAAQRSIGWPEHVSDAARDGILQASKAQTQIVDQIIEAWEQQLRSSGETSMLPHSFMYQMPGLSGSPLAQTTPELVRLGEMSMAPLRVWMQAANMWQRDWARLMSMWVEPRPSRPRKDIT